MDYPNRRRLKIFARIQIQESTQSGEVLRLVAMSEYRAKVERALIFKLEAFDWNCPRHITRRFSEAELISLVAPYREHIQQLEAENARLKASLVLPPAKRSAP
jgi:hypothetical protein